MVIEVCIPAVLLTGVAVEGGWSGYTEMIEHHSTSRSLLGFILLGSNICLVEAKSALLAATVVASSVVQRVPVACFCTW